MEYVYFAALRRRVDAGIDRHFMQWQPMPESAHIFPYRPISAMTAFRATFMGSESGSFAEGAPSQSQR